jgi:ABC-type dipeptide/oligopeptide/nickel transport system ATPase subunit
MASKTEITITHEELIRMKMRANILPNCIATFMQLIMKKIGKSINTNKVKSGPISGEITLKISKKERRKFIIENLKRRSLNADVLTRKRGNFSTR